MNEYKYGNPDEYGDFPYLYQNKWNNHNADDKYSKLNEILMERLPDDYPMQLVDQNEIEVLADCVNQGIDSHLEAATLSTKEHLVPIEIGDKVYGHKYGIGFDKTGMVCLIRRLMEYNPNLYHDFSDCDIDPESNCGETTEEREMWDASYQLVSSILETLQIEYSGC